MKLLRNILIVIFLIIMLAIGVLVAVQNTELVPLDLLVYNFAPRSLAFWVLSALLLGGLLGVGASALIMLRLRLALSATKRQLDRARGQAREASPDAVASGTL